MGVEIVRMSAEIDAINAKLRKKIYQGKDLEEPSTAKPIYDDGLDELRRLNKENGVS